MLFDTYKKVLIKAFETLRRQGEEPEYKITGHDQSPGMPVGSGKGAEEFQF